MGLGKCHTDKKYGPMFLNLLARLTTSWLSSPQNARISKPQISQSADYASTLEVYPAEVKK